MDKDELQYVYNSEGTPTAVIVSIDVWHEVTSEKETQHLLRSKKMVSRLKEARASRSGLSEEHVRAKLGI